MSIWMAIFGPREDLEIIENLKKNENFNLFSFLTGPIFHNFPKRLIF
jgi:hypothetical protein